jgi:hypothetical protein
MVGIGDAGGRRQASNIGWSLPATTEKPQKFQCLCFSYSEIITLIIMSEITTVASDITGPKCKYCNDSFTDKRQ